MTVVLAALLSVVVAAPSAAHADESQYTEFYTIPDPLPDGVPGDLIRSEPSRLVLEPSGQLGAYVARGTRIMYRSTDNRGDPIAVTGTYYEPDNPWPGAGPRPLIAYGPNLPGLGDQCAPSRLANQGIHYGGGTDITMWYEEGFIATMVARGFAVVVTDYDGVGTGLPSPAFMRLPQGYALIDAARAAMRLPETSLDPHGPIAFWGYGEGGGASASAAELAPSYAPELHVVGAWAGAPATDPVLIPAFADGGLLEGGLGYLVNGVLAAYPELRPGLMETLTPRGAQLVDQTRLECFGQTVIRYEFRHSQPYFNTDYHEMLESDPLKTVFAAQRVGTLKPAAPVFVDINRYDPLIPWGAAHQTALDWCAKGADVQFWTNEEPPIFNKLAINDLLTYFVDGERGMQWVAGRFNGVPTNPNCGQI